MDRDYIRRRTTLIVEKDGYFLQGRSCLTGELIWTWSKYDAWQTRTLRDAARIALVLGGTLWMFNPLMGDAVPAKMTVTAM